MHTAHRKFHDFYSRTYPRYEAYSAKEQQKDLVTMINVICDNKNKIFEQNLYYTKDGTINPVFKKNVISAIGTELSSELSVPVIQAITMVLSSPDASVALEAPVINLMASSPRVQTQTVNVIADALSVGVLSAQMDYAVSQSLASPQAQNITIGTVQTAIKDNKLSNELFEATEKALSTPEISTAMINPVKNVISSNEVSGTVADIAAEGNKISAIHGGTDIKDDNGNGIPDEEEGLMTMVFGGLGA